MVSARSTGSTRFESRIAAFGFALAALGVALLGGCDSGDGSLPGSDATVESASETRLVTLSYPLVAFPFDRHHRWSREGEIETARLHFSRHAPRVLIHRASGALNLRLDAFAGAELRARARLLPTLKSRGTERATFAVRAGRGAESADGEVLFETTLVTGDTEDLALSIPADARWLHLAVDFPATSAARAVWQEPILVRYEERRRPSPGSPNLLLVTVDTTRVDELGSYGGVVPTPNLESLVRDGFRFTAAHSLAYGTAPSHASLFTARPVGDHRVLDNGSVLRRSEITLAETLRLNGYVTAAFVSAAPVSRMLGFDQGFDLYDDGVVRDTRSELGGTGKFERRSDATVERWTAWFDALPHDETFFSWLHFFDAHLPYRPRAGYAERFSEGTLESKSPAAQRARYRGEIAYVDEQLGHVLAALRERGVYENTVIVFVSDHGENFFERSRRLAYTHAGLHAEVTHLPLVIKPPHSAGFGGLPVEVAALVSNGDVAPTVLETLGVAAPATWAGTSLVPWMRAAAEGDPAPRPPHASLLLEGTRRREFAVRTERWLYRELRLGKKARPEAFRGHGFAVGVPVELYDLEADPSALENVADLHPEELARLTRGTALGPAPLAEEPEFAVSPEHREALEALGYVE
jgi:arylsulfatase A-like enzyme